MSLPKGRTNNPNGRPPKGQCLTDLLKKYLEEPSINNPLVTRKVEFVEKVYELAKGGDTICIKLIWSYTDGLPVQPIDHVFTNPLLEVLNKHNADTDNTNGDD